VLSTLKVTSTERFDALQDAARRILPRLRRLGFQRKKLLESRPRTLTVEGQKVLVPDKATVIADELLLDFDDATALPAHVASEGTLIVLGILAALYAGAQPGLLLVDDLDRALHPQAQRDLVLALRAALDAKPRRRSSRPPTRPTWWTSFSRSRSWCSGARLAGRSRRSGSATTPRRASSTRSARRRQPRESPRQASRCRYPGASRRDDGAPEAIRSATFFSPRTSVGKIVVFAIT
jgi:hypothetical protein